MAKLTILQKRCCDIYFAMGKPNQAKAYKLAGSKSKGKTLIVEACRTLKKPQCREYLEKLGKRATVRAERSADEVIRELELLGFSNIQDFLGEDNEVKDLSQLDRDTAAAVESVQSDIRHDKGDSDGYTEKVKFKLHSKQAALEALARRFKLFGENQPTIGDVKIQIIHFGRNGDK